MFPVAVSGISYNDTVRPAETLRRFDEFLAAKGQRFEAVVVGGAILNLLGIVLRPTKDCDVLQPSIPPAIAETARAFAAESRAHGETLGDDWLNNGPSSLADVLPAGWELRLVDVFSGTALTIRSLGRGDLLLTKLFALCDRGLDLADCIALAPTAAELSTAHAWLATQDANPDWPEHVTQTLADLAGRVGHGV